MPGQPTQDLDLTPVVELANYKPSYVAMMVPIEAIEDLVKVLRVIIRKAGAIAHDTGNDDATADDVYDLLGTIGDVARDIIDEANNALDSIRRVFGY
jgi:hypothetical protein